MNYANAHNTKRRNRCIQVLAWNFKTTLSVIDKTNRQNKEYRKLQYYNKVEVIGVNRTLTNHHRVHTLLHYNGRAINTDYFLGHKTVSRSTGWC
jgi:hypothetical protein